MRLSTIIRQSKDKRNKCQSVSVFLPKILQYDASEMYSDRR